MLGAYLIIKVRDYTSATLLIKKTIATPQKVEKQYQNKISDIEKQIDNTQIQQQKLEVEPSTYRNRQKLQRGQKQMAKLKQKKKEVESALSDYQTIVEKMGNEDNPNIKQDLRSYLHNKNRL
ncbi:hypothetical protein DS835_01515 [Lactobacillus bombicola]|uniref:Uncharacterized protein n=2 Tax=Lactobacillus bombicola TaxID=1505723 RepID=A0A396SWR5_9LACO|nr:hypothetical protein DS834_07865 [Lactobacillus bombicola]RHW55080.1 hypothetical protein DS835_01515 [Lactobacillus bombicola]